MLHTLNMSAQLTWYISRWSFTFPSCILVDRFNVVAAAAAYSYQRLYCIGQVITHYDDMAYWRRN